MNDLFCKNIANHVLLESEQLQQFYNLFEYRSYKKKACFLTAGETCNYEGFVTKGLFRIYYPDHNGDASILYFASEDWWITDLDSFTNQRPSSLIIEALEDSEVLVISKKNKEYAYEHLPFIEKLFRVMTQKTHIAMQRRMIDNLSKTADVRYLDFINKYPQLYNRLSNRQIAAYLGVSHEFISKIRKKIVK
jgi:CRP-like cAMP-binding protein